MHQGRAVCSFTLFCSHIILQLENWHDDLWELPHAWLPLASIRPATERVHHIVVACCLSTLDLLDLLGLPACPPLSHC
jgi:hypothetical protein